MGGAAAGMTLPAMETHNDVLTERQVRREAFVPPEGREG